MHEFSTFNVNQYFWVSDLLSRSCYENIFYWNSI
nr:MAG TPA_asm: hypothetical protein [Bacteriophage sp.]